MFKNMYHRNIFFMMFQIMLMPFMSAIQRTFVENSGGGSVHEQNEKDNLVKDIVKSIDEKIEAKASKFTTKEELTLLSKSIDELKEVAVKQGETLQNMVTVKSYDNLDWNREIRDVLNQVKLNKQNHVMTPVELNLGKYIEKTAAQILRSTNVTGEIPQAYQLPGFIVQVMRKFTLRQYCNNFSTGQTFQVAWNIANSRDGAGAATSEGNAKPLIDIDLTRATKDITKVAARFRISTELLDDIAEIERLMRDELMYQVMLAVENGLFNGNGTPPNLTGVTTYAQTLDLTSLRNTVDSPNYWDVLRAAKQQIEINGEYKFMPNACFINGADAYKMYSSKTTSGEPVLPYYYQLQPDGIGNPIRLPVIETNMITAGNYLIGDMTRFNVAERLPFTLKMGLDGTDFSENKVTFVGETRLASFAAATDTEAFIYDSFANGLTFIDSGS